MRFILIALLLTITIGCFEKEKANVEVKPIDHANASAVLAKYNSLISDENLPAPDQPKVGDKCPQCNSPPGKCGVGKVGDGVICDTCLMCNGDGRIDESDLQTYNYSFSNKKIIMYSRSTCPWCTKWEREIMPKLLDKGWEIEKIEDRKNSVPNFKIFVNNKEYKYVGYMSIEKLNSFK